MDKLVQRHQPCNSELTQKYSRGKNTAKPCVTVIMFEKQNKFPPNFTFLYTKLLYKTRTQ